MTSLAIQVLEDQSVQSTTLKLVVLKNFHYEMSNI